jgi:hypothetical protein
LLFRNLGLVLAADLDSTHPPRLFDSLALHLRILITEIAPASNPEVLADLVLSAMSAPMLHRLICDRGYAIEDVQASVRDLLHGIIPAR